MKQTILIIAGLLVLSACAMQRDVNYCKRHGEVEGTPEFGRCLDYFHKQDAMFQRDLDICNEQADVTYPPSLYDYGGTRYATVHGGYGFGHGMRKYPYHHGGWSGTRHVAIDIYPDYRHNTMIDDLRHRIILPCMQKRGWQSAKTWELGRINK